MQQNTAAIRITSGMVLRVLGTLAVLLVVLATAGQVVKHVLGHERAGGFVHQFYLSEDNNVATYFGALLTLFAAVLLGFIAQDRRHEEHGRATHWLTLSLVFLALSVEEAVRFSLFLNAVLKGVFLKAGVPLSPGLVWAALAVLLAVWYLPLLHSLPGRTRLQFVVAGGLYVVGGLPLEYAGRMYGLDHGYENLTFALLSIAEETVEIAGMLLFIYALLTYLERHVREVCIRFG